MKSFKNFNLKKFNSYGITSYCDTVFFPDSESDIVRLFSELKDSQPYIIGNGNNLILSKEKYDEPFIILNGCFNKIEVEGSKIVAEAGATLLELSQIALNQSLSGFEMFYDIPSSVGGAVVMNAGSSGEEIKDLLTKVRYFDRSKNLIEEISVEDIHFEYRNSFFQQNPDKLVLKSSFRLKEGNQEAINAKMEEIKMKRWAKQPRNYPNCGSVFKRPEGRFVGPLLDELKLKGYRVGGAMVSEKHSGFIINYENASGYDILKLIDHIQSEVLKHFGVQLEVEQRII
ncbi:UDP-N-acetylmuramate dehydrogenase [Christiangramia gaetbulicola]|uniref:UDP-N-acetylenolpyruvoylglucosamine reductase n=1 Tax=Christiangramia gaetbulicola TaxID=703340 RepID=A0A2T6AL59_9FLAO|nr:UDP-N-acetylmuramate dehydrogenase [Christiangramia gaetbulicola]PTX44486.1 UDP-N-acetylmuramate dehydrogenase [Christiangramia gaetbulicola]